MEKGITKLGSIIKLDAYENLYGIIEKGSSFCGKGTALGKNNRIVVGTLGEDWTNDCELVGSCILCSHINNIGKQWKS